MTAVLLKKVASRARLGVLDREGLNCCPIHAHMDHELMFIIGGIGSCLMG